MLLGFPVLTYLHKTPKNCYYFLSNWETVGTT
jgi:hypothetical protein